jgi:hypothetical protein
MWNMRNYFAVEELPARRIVIQFRFADETSEYDRYWVVIQPAAPVEICTSIPGFEIDLFIETNVTSLLGIFMGRTTVSRERELGGFFSSGDAVLSRTLSSWLRTHDYASFEGIAQLPDRRSRNLVEDVPNQFPSIRNGIPKTPWQLR